MQVIEGGAWVEQWKRFYRPFKLGKRLVIRPPWESYTAAADELLLTLNPGQAFGTGLHATTQLCLASLETIIGMRPGGRRPTSVVAAGSSAWPECYSAVGERTASMSIAWPFGWHASTRG